MRGRRARLGAVGLALFGALTVATLSASSASADSRVYGYSAEISGLRVQIYSQMCDDMGKPLHTRLGVKNTASISMHLCVHDSYVNAVYVPPCPIAPGMSSLVHLTSSKRTPRHTLTLAS